jgi:hypothetical protein
VSGAGSLKSLGKRLGVGQIFLPGRVKGLAKTL